MNCTIHPDIEATAPCARCGMSYCGGCLGTRSEERLCANCKGEALRDVMSGMHTTRLPLARIGARYVAYLVDHAMLWVVSLGVLRFGMLRSRRLLLTTIGLRTLRNLQLAAQIMIAILYFLYEALMVARRGQTLGKMLLRVRVVNEEASQESEGAPC